MKKTSGEWFNDLREPERSQAKANCEFLGSAKVSLRDAIDGFEWESSSEGFEYWNEIYDELLNGTYFKDLGVSNEIVTLISIIELTEHKVGLETLKEILPKVKRLEGLQ